MVAAQLGASALISALNSKKTVKATANLTKAVGGINEAEDNGTWDNLNAITSGLSIALPVTTTLKVIMAKLQSATAKSTINLTKEVLALLEVPAVKLVLDVVFKILNLTISSSTDILKIASFVINSIPGLSGALHTLSVNLQKAETNVVSFGAAAVGMERDVASALGRFYVWIDENDLGDELIALAKKQTLNYFIEIGRGFEDLGASIRTAITDSFTDLIAWLKSLFLDPTTLFGEIKLKFSDFVTIEPITISASKLIEIAGVSLF